jgi:hypothetical protein
VAASRRGETGCPSKKLLLDFRIIEKYEEIMNEI